jgi:hypothetical protein
VDAQDKLNVKQALELLDGSLQAITSFDVRLNCSHKNLLQKETVVDVSEGRKRIVVKSSRKLYPNEAPKILRQSFREVYQRGKGRLEFTKGDYIKSPWRIVFDPETQKTYRPQENDATISSKPTELILEGWDYLEAFRSVHGSLPILVAFKERKNAVINEGASSETLLVLESAPCLDAPNVSYGRWGLRVALDKNHGFLPSSIERSEEISGKLLTVRRTTIRQWKDLGGGVWVPISTITHFFDSDPNLATFGELANELTLVVDVSRSSWNKEIAESTFNLPLPPGVKVIDTLREVQFVTGKPDPGDNLDDLAANARNLVPYPVLKAPPVESHSPWMWIIGGVTTLFCALALWVSVRFLRKHR